MYLKKVEADIGGYNPYEPIQDWNRITYEETIRGKKYEVLRVVDVDYLNEHAKELIERFERDFANVRNPITEEIVIREIEK